MPPAPWYTGMYQKSSIIQIRHIAFHSLYNMSKCFQLLSAFVDVVAVALTDIHHQAAIYNQMVTSIYSVQITYSSLNSNLNFSSPFIVHFDTHLGYSVNLLPTCVHSTCLNIMLFSIALYSLLVYQHYSSAVSMKRNSCATKLRLRFGDIQSVLSDSHLYLHSYIW